MFPLVAIVGGFASGVFLRSIFIFGWPVIIFIFLISRLFVGAKIRKPRLAYSLGAVFFIFVALGMMRAMVADTPLPEAFAREVKHRVSYEAVVVADPDVRDANQRVEVRVLAAKVSTIMLAVAPRYPSVAVGDRITVSGTLAIPEAFADAFAAGSGETGGRIFRYDKYLQRDGVRFILNFAYLRVQNDSVALAPW